MNTAQSIFSLCDKVITKKLGPPSYGVVVGIILAKPYFDDYILYSNNNIGAFAKWLTEYPDCMNENKFLILVQFDKPQRMISYTEYCTNTNPILHSKAAYEIAVPSQLISFYPEEDLELF